MNLPKATFAALVVGALGLIGCGGGFSCKDKGKCGNDLPHTQEEIDSCQKSLDEAKCGDKYRDFQLCFRDNEKCTAAGDVALSDTLTACKDQLSAYEGCCNQNAGSCP